MEHGASLITTIALALGMALIFGFLAERIGLPAIIGYLLAGIIIGPATPGLVADLSIATELAEIGVIFLMFGVGLHFSLDDLLSVKRIAVPGAVVQMAAATVLGGLMAHYWWGWAVGQAIVFGLTLSCASTVVLLKALEARDLVDTQNGRIAIGWLVVEDLATVVLLVLLPATASLLGGHNDEAHSGPLWLQLVWTVLGVVVFVAIMLIGGRRLLPMFLAKIEGTGSRELFTLAVAALALGIAYIASELFNVSFALGAFFAGMVMRESEFSHRAANDSLALRDAFAVIFFVAVGMMFMPSVLIEQPLQVIGVVAIVMIGKSIAAIIIVLLFRYSLKTAFTVSASLAQIGEFSFLLAALALQLQLIPEVGNSLVLAGALVSIALNPAMFTGTRALRLWLVDRFPAFARLDKIEDPYAELPAHIDPEQLRDHVVLIGYGRVGRRIAESLDANAIPYVVCEVSRERVEDLRKEDVPAISGNAADQDVLARAGIERAAVLALAVPDANTVRSIVDAARGLRPELEIILRTHSDAQTATMNRIGTTVYGEDVLAKGMLQPIIEHFEQ